MRSARSTAPPRGASAAMVALLGMVAGLLGVVAAPAGAAPPYATPATVTDLQFTETSVEPALSTPATAELTASFSLPDNPTPTAGFQISLDTLQGPSPSRWAEENTAGEHWQVRFVGTTFPLLDATDTAMGTCTVTPSEVTCDIDSDYIAAHPLNISGQIALQVAIFGIVTPDEGTVPMDYEFTVNGSTRTADIDLTQRTWCDPATDPQDCTYSHHEPWKSGVYRTDVGAPAVDWLVEVPGPAGGHPGGTQISVTDTPGAGLSFADTYPFSTTNPRVLACDTATGLRFDWEGGFTRCSVYEEVTTGVSLSPDHATVTITAQEGYQYRLLFWTDVAGTPQNGDLLTNSVEASIDGEPATYRGQTRVQEGSGTIIGENEGRFSIIKTVRGDADVDAEQSFDVAWTVSEPGGDELASGVATLTGVDDPSTPEQENRWNSPAAYPVGSTVHLQEAPPTGSPAVTWDDPVITPNDFAIEGGSTTLASVVNTARLVTGGFSVTKAVSGTGADLIDDDTEFTVDYTWPAGHDYPAGSGTLTVADGETVVVDDVPAGAVVTLTERTPDAVAGATWSAGVFDPATLTIVADQTATTTLANVLTADVGGFALTKAVTGTGAALADDDTEFTVDYAWPAGNGFTAGAGTIVLHHAQTVAVDDVPAGAVVTLTERTPDAVAGATWTAAAFDPATLTIARGATATTTLTNTLTADVGAFTLTKAVTGTGAALADDDTEFTVDYAWPAGSTYAAGSGSLHVTDGETASVSDVPAGAVVTLTERTPDAVAGATWTAAAFDPATLTIARGATATTTLTNTLTAEVPPGTPGPPGKEAPPTPAKPGLPQTGSAPHLLALAAIALLLMTAGLATLGAARRRVV